MTLTPGEYTFECDECDGDGSVQVIQEDDEAPEGYSPTWIRCEECRGEGKVHVDEDEAAEIIEYGGRTPLKAPAAT